MLCLRKVSVVSRRINSTGSISRDTISDLVNSCVPASNNHHGVLHAQYLVNGRSHSGTRILWMSRGEETKQYAVYFLTTCYCLLYSADAVSSTVLNFDKILCYGQEMFPDFCLNIRYLHVACASLQGLKIWRKTEDKHLINQNLINTAKHFLCLQYGRS